MPELNADDPKTKAGKGGATDWVAAFAHGDLITAEGILTAESAAEGIVTKGTPYEEDTEEARARRAHEAGQQMAAAVTSFRNAMYSMGNYSISYREASESLREMEQDIDSGLEVSRYFDQQAQNNIAYNPDGTPMTRAQITAHENAIGACTMMTTEGEAQLSAASLAEQEAQAAAMKEEIARFNNGEITDINALSQNAQAVIMEDKIKTQLAAGETINLQDVPQHLRANAIDLILSHEDESIMARALQTEGLTVQQWKDGALMQDSAVASRVMDQYSELRDARRGTLSKEAGIDPNAPAATQTIDTPQGGVLGALNALSSKSPFNVAASGEAPAAPSTPEQNFTAPRQTAAMTAAM